MYKTSFCKIAFYPLQALEGACSCKQQKMHFFGFWLQFGEGNSLIILSSGNEGVSIMPGTLEAEQVYR